MRFIAGLISLFASMPPYQRAKKDFLDSGLVPKVDFNDFSNRDKSKRKELVYLMCKMFKESYTWRGLVAQVSEASGFYDRLVSGKKLDPFNPDSDSIFYLSTLKDAVEEYHAEKCGMEFWKRVKALKPKIDYIPIRSYDDDWFIARPLNFNASRTIGGMTHPAYPTGWCTVADASHFKNYNDEGMLVYAINMSDPEEKYAAQYVYSKDLGYDDDNRDIEERFFDREDNEIRAGRVNPEVLEAIRDYAYPAIDEEAGTADRESVEYLLNHICSGGYTQDKDGLYYANIVKVDRIEKFEDMLKFGINFGEVKCFTLSNIESKNISKDELLEVFPYRITELLEVNNVVVPDVVIDLNYYIPRILFTKNTGLMINVKSVNYLGISGDMYLDDSYVRANKVATLEIAYFAVTNLGIFGDEIDILKIRGRSNIRLNGICHSNINNISITDCSISAFGVKFTNRISEIDFIGCNFEEKSLVNFECITNTIDFNKGSLHMASGCRVNAYDAYFTNVNFKDGAMGSLLGKVNWLVLKNCKNLKSFEGLKNSIINKFTFYSDDSVPKDFENLPNKMDGILIQGDHFDFNNGKAKDGRDYRQVLKEFYSR